MHCKPGASCHSHSSLLLLLRDKGIYVSGKEGKSPELGQNLACEHYQIYLWCSDQKDLLAQDYSICQQKPGQRFYCQEKAGESADRLEQSQQSEVLNRKRHRITTVSLVTNKINQSLRLQLNYFTNKADKCEPSTQIMLDYCTLSPKCCQQTRYIRERTETTSHLRIPESYQGKGTPKPQTKQQ